MFDEFFFISNEVEDERSCKNPTYGFLVICPLTLHFVLSPSRSQESITAGDLKKPGRKILVAKTNV